LCSGFRVGKSYSFRWTLTQSEIHCQETKDTSRKLQLLYRLIQNGVHLPEYSFIILSREVSHGIPWLKTESFIDEQFQDKAHFAMVSVKEFLYNDVQEARLTASGVLTLRASPTYLLMIVACAFRMLADCS
jgi:hypothetical protein